MKKDSKNREMTCPYYHSDLMSFPRVFMPQRQQLV